MTKALIKLHATLWRRTATSNPSVIVMAVLIGLYAFIGMASVGFMLFFRVREGSSEIVPAAVAVGMIAYIVLMAMMPSGEQQVTARDLAVFPITARQARSALWPLIFLHSRSLVSLLCTLSTAAVVCAAAGSGLAFAVGLPMLTVAFATTVLAGEVIGRLLGRGAVGKDRLAAWSAVGVMALILGFNLVLNGDGSLPLEAVGRVLAWTPFGATGGALAAALTGQWGVGVAQGLIAIATLGALLWLWLRGVAQDLREPQIHIAAGRKKEKVRSDGDALPTVFLPMMPRNPATAIFSRALRYVRRDSRMIGSVLIIPLVMVFFLYRGYAQDAFNAYMGAFILCFFLAGICSNDFGYDGPSGWLHLVSGVRPRTLLLARHAGSVAIPGAFFLLYAALMVAILPNRAMTTMVLSAVLGYWLSAAASGLYLTVYNAFPTARPGTSPWSDRSGYSSAAMVTGFGFLLLGWVPLAPGALLLGLGAIKAMLWASVLGGVLAVAVPLALYLVAMRVSVRRLERTWSEIYQKVRSWVN
ncbi:hypothetical protein H7347_01845 [Corynebacterium sp. zg-331]|uniref:hypothetical protein n=1 Tax=unclassified Corynebacterium TaxID=2624378 RepID=UPI00128E70BB|nr:MULTISPECIES: hypothetical protein [unclassified Corynebacterium]MBC3185329.1 hypothetical protein [Corynebacterium sp. zg-331]MPV51826.1 hypothetical protein [Corynebacterium sp. zg331]